MLMILRSIKCVILSKYISCHLNGPLLRRMDRLSDVIATHSCGKPIMIFCSTRNSTVTTAKELSRWWSNTSPPARLWKGPGRRVEVHNFDLKGMAFFR